MNRTSRAHSDGTVIDNARITCVPAEFGLSHHGTTLQLMAQCSRAAAPQMAMTRARQKPPMRSASVMLAPTSSAHPEERLPRRVRGGFAACPLHRAHGQNPLPSAHHPH